MPQTKCLCLQSSFLYRLHIPSFPYNISPLTSSSVTSFTCLPVEGSIAPTFNFFLLLTDKSSKTYLVRFLSAAETTNSRGCRTADMACVAKYNLHNLLDYPEHPRKRRRLTSSWDVLPSGQKAQHLLDFTVQALENGEGFPDGASSPSDSSSEHGGSTLPCPKSNGDQPFRYVSPPWRNDDKEGHYQFSVGDNLTPRYKIICKMGEGTFGQVLECWDRTSRDLVAIKVTRGLQKYREDALIEIDVLREVAKYDKTGKRCVQMREWFDYRNHTCIVFEKLGPSLYDYLKKNSFRPFPIYFVREIGRQLLESIAYMHDLKLVHTDLKPENILFVSSDFVKVPDYKGTKRSTEDNSMRLPKSSAIKLIDFGSTVFEDQDHMSVISTRHYRAPEVILGIGWNYPCDIWSVGCILVELCTGETLFQTHENLEHLAMMERILGPLPRHMIKRADSRSAKYFRHRTRVDWPEGASSRESIGAVRKVSKLGNFIKQNVVSAGLLIDLLQGLLKFEPSERLTAREALRHPFFKED